MPAPISASRSIPFNTRSAFAAVPRTMRNRSTQYPTRGDPDQPSASRNPDYGDVRYHASMTLQHPGPGRAGRFVSPYCGAQAVELAQDTKRSTKILFKSANSRERNGLRLPTPPDLRRERPGEIPANLADATHDVRYCNALASVTRFILVIHHIIVPRMQQRGRGAPRTSSTLCARASVVFRYGQVPDISC